MPKIEKNKLPSFTKITPESYPKYAKILGLIFALILVASIATAGYFYQESQKLKNQRLTANETKELVEKVGKLVVLPTDEEPTIASVTDLEKLKDQPFFASAKIGDKVLIYTKAKKAILYRPSDNKIIEIAPLNIGESSPNQIQPVDTKTQITIKILNGSGVAGMASRVAAKLNQGGFTQTSVGDASSQLEETIIQFKSGDSESATTINHLLNNQGKLSANENILSDIVITLGKNFKPE